MLITKTTQNNHKVYDKGQPIERVRKYKYLNTTINENNHNSQKV